MATEMTETDNSELYGNIGDIVIQRAYAGNKDCLRIFELAVKKTAQREGKSNSK